VVVASFSQVIARFGQPVAGVMGHPFLREAVVVIDCPASWVTSVDPRHYRLPRHDWHPLTFRHQRPHVHGRLPGDHQ
jgi:hypothetical protein